MGAALSARLVSNLSASGLDPELVTQLLNPLPGSETVIDSSLRFAVANAINLVFVVAFVAAVFAFVSTFFSPHQELKERTMEGEPIPMSAD